MTREEAIEYGIRWKNAIIDCGDTENSEAVQFLNMAIEALEEKYPCGLCKYYEDKEDWGVCQYCPAEPKDGDEE